MPECHEGAFIRARDRIPFVLNPPRERALAGILKASLSMKRLVGILSLAIAWAGFASAQPFADAAPIAEAEAAPAVYAVLSAEDVARYQELFALQDAGDWKRADAVIATIENDILMGYAQYQRYMHPTAYRSAFGELKRWMAYYADHPEADKIYALARKRRPRGESNPLRPISRQWKTAPDLALHPVIEADYEKTGRPRLNQIEGRVRYLSNREQALTAKKEIDAHLARGRITERQHDRMSSWIAASLYYQGYVDTAKSIANDAAKNGDTGVLAYWIAGLIDYREGNIAAAHAHFDAMAAVPYQEDSLRAAAGFWAARAALASGALDRVAPNLEIAAAKPFTFYGQLALAQLGRDQVYDWTAPTLTADELDALIAQEPRVARAIALAQTGREDEADLELRWAAGSAEPGAERALLAVATALNLPAAQMDIALSSGDEHLASGLFPIPDYAPADGFKIDRALIYALMRQESKFKTEATSRVGARGLMQLMPRTASYVAKDRSLRYRSGRDRLYDPAFNLSLGQTYVGHLIDTTAQGDLFHLAAAYNGGPGNLSRWKREVAIDDPLLFIESIPNRESRDFVEHVLTNFWIYRARLGQPAPSRDRVAAGELPLYEALDQIAGE